MEHFAKLYLLILPGISLWIAIRLIDGFSSRSHDKLGGFSVLRWISILLILFGILGFGATLLNPIGIVLSPILLICGLSLLTFRIQSSRAIFARSLILAVGKKIDLTSVARCMANDASWLTRGKLQRVANRMEASPSHALTFFDEIDLYPSIHLSLSLHGAGVEVGELIERLESIEDRYRRSVREWVEAMLYFLGLATLISFGLTFVRFRLVFQLQRMLAEFSFNDPSLQERVDLFLIPEVGWCIIGATVLFLCAFSVASFFYLDFFSKRRGWLRWGHRRYDSACALLTISDLAARKLSYSESLRLIEVHHPLKRIRRETVKIRSYLSEGDLSYALHRVGWISAQEAEMLKGGEERGGYGQKLARIADSRLALADRGWQWMAKILAPLGFLALGACVASIAINIILLLSQLIEVVQ